MNQIIDFKRLPQCLKRPLVFGDAQQIQALKDMETAAEEQEKLEAALEAGELIEFTVHIEFSGTKNTRVIARDARDAMEIAQDSFDADDADVFNVDFVRAYPVTRKDEAPVERSFNETPLFNVNQ